jgi:hypothetical protein
MSNQAIINELLSLEAFADELKQRCYKARKKLERVYAPASERGKASPLSDSDRMNLRGSRRKTIRRNQ